jgi:hypothetical protein
MNPYIDIPNEAARASEKNGAFHSTHEGMGVLLEEFNELASAIGANSPTHIYREAVQVAAVACRIAEAVANAMPDRPNPFSLRSGWVE